MKEIKLIDTHIHILPGVDDGSRTLYETFEMAEIAANNHVIAVVATPHCNMPGYFENYYDKYYVEMFKRTRQAIQTEGIPLQLLPGAEAYATYDLPELVKEGKIMTLNRSKYLLLEFSFGEDPNFATNILDQIRAIGLIPVVAHVERYEFVQDNPQIIYEWRQKGYLIQVNKASFQGKFGELEQITAHKLMEHNLISVIASDAHRARIRSPYMMGVYEQLSNMYGEKKTEVLMSYNPLRICNNKPTLKLPMKPIED